MHAMVSNDRQYVVVGLGATGLACVRHLRALGCRVAVTDSRAEPPGLEALRAEYPEVAVASGGFDAAMLAAAEHVILSPGVALAEPVLQSNIGDSAEVISEIELFARAVHAPVIAITGSNGKSTVTTLVGEMLREAGMRAAVGGNLGTPALDLLTQQPDAQVYVLELSSFQLETTYSLKARAATVLNISADHMDRYAGLDDYAAAKAKVYTNADYRIVNADDPAVLALAPLSDRTKTFSVTRADADFSLVQHQGRAWLAAYGEPLLAVDETRLIGRHNQSNMLAAMALAEAMTVPREAMIGALRRFTGLAHRMQWVAERDGVLYVNDSKGTNVGATVAALTGLQRPAVLIAGGDGKKADFHDLLPAMREFGRAAVLIGRDASALQALLETAVPCQRADTMLEAVRKARALAHHGDAVLLSPACASFDMYANYQARGEAFVRAVAEVTA